MGGHGAFLGRRGHLWARELGDDALAEVPHGVGVEKAAHEPHPDRGPAAVPQCSAVASAAGPTPCPARRPSPGLAAAATAASVPRPGR